MKIFAKSSDYSKLFKDNKSCDFRIEVLRHTNFEANAQVTLTNLIVPPLEADTELFILCSVCAYSQSGEVYRRVLRVLQLYASKSARQVFLEPLEKYDLNQNTFQEIRFSFKDGKDQFIKFDPAYDTFIGLEIK
jgi:hypothetical protein